MAQSGFTPIQLYRTATASAAPSAGNLADGELAINTNDGRLFYKDSTGVVRTMASSSSSSGVFAPGTVSAPGITFTGDTNTGIYSPAADTIAFTEGGTEAMRLDASGNVGIGTASPAYRLDVAAAPASGGIRIQSSFASELVFLNNNGAVISNASNTPLVFNNNGSERMRIDISGNVGIGTSSPAGRLHARFDAGAGDSFTGRYIFQTTDQRLTIGTYWQAGVGQNARIQSSTDAGTAQSLLLNPDGGNVGVGTSSPGTTLDVRFAFNPPTDNGGGANALRVYTTAAQAADIGGAISLGGAANTGSAAGFGFGQIAGRKENSTSGNFAGYLSFATNSAGGGMTERMRIDASGNVGIGTSSPAARLNVAGGRSLFAANGEIYNVALGFNQTRAGTGQVYYLGATDAISPDLSFSNSGGIERFRFGASGQLGIGGANYGTSGQVLTSNGAGSAPSWQNAGGTANGLLLNVQVFTSSGTYTRTANVTRAVVIAVGGGGGSGGSRGSAGTAATNGGSGGTTSFGSHVSAAGGGGGAQATFGGTGTPGAGGSGGAGSIISIRGEWGHGAARDVGALNGGGQGGGGGGTAGVRGGGGGASVFGQCGTIAVSGPGGQGETAIDYITAGLGATETVTIGAGGTAGSGGSAGNPGSAGGAGYIIVYEYS